MTRVTGSKNGNAIRATFAVQTEQIKQMNDSICLVLVSIKNNKFCSDKWFTAITRSSVSIFKNVTFLIVDELQRYNTILESENSIYTEKELNEKTKALRDEWWLENEAAFLLLFEDQPYLYRKLRNTLINKTVLEKIVEINNAALERGLNFNILTWSDWLASCPSYLTEEEVLKAQYETVDLLRDSLNASAEEFALRKSKNDNNLYLKAVKIAKEFLLEEAPGFMIVGARLNYDFVAYTGEMAKVFEITHQHFVQNNFPGKMQWIDINFEKYRSSTIQLKQEKSVESVNGNPFLYEVCLVNEEEVFEK